ncbi:uncharacterized protein LOC126840923 isoform X2 [Adelges cooleyi]|uniref:uncharacterized protein LOC126840923 isoform X2 n=1 Tax=Adelges cooleyi TaxID=133065 RepID=UPI00218073F3|nr:uncharacterized protein LOC126840923 isoform X2 [Adelges cooleyi]
MRLTVCTSAQTTCEQVARKIEILFEEKVVGKLTLIGTPLNNMPLNNNGIPVIVQKMCDFITNYGLCNKHLFDAVYTNRELKKNIVNAYELFNALDQNDKKIVEVEAADVATMLAVWLYYLPDPLISSKQYLMICDMHSVDNCADIIKPMGNTSEQTLRQVMRVVESYEKQHKSYKGKLQCLFQLLFTKNIQIGCKENAAKFMSNLKTILKESDMKKIQNKTNHNKMLTTSTSKKNWMSLKSLAVKNIKCNKKIFWSMSDDGLLCKTGTREAINAKEPTSGSALKRSSSCQLAAYKLSDEKLYTQLTENNVLVDKENSQENKENKQFPQHLFQESSVNLTENEMANSQIDEMRTMERTVQYAPRTHLKSNRKKSIKNYVEKILKSGLLPDNDCVLLQNTLELMKLLATIKSIQSQINNLRKNNDEELEAGKLQGTSENVLELRCLENRLEKLENQKNICLIKTGLSYGRLYNRTVLNLRNAQREAFKQLEEEKNHKNSHSAIENLLSDIYNVEKVLDHLQNNCGCRELPWRSSKGCPGSKRKSKRQLNCVSVVLDLQTISENEVMEILPQPIIVFGAKAE